MNEVGFNREYSMLLVRYRVLKERAASLIESLHALVNIIGPNIKARYMMFIGHLEYKVYELNVELMRWRRRFALRQAALNCGEKPDRAAIEDTLEEEFAEYMEKINSHIKEIKADEKHFFAEKLTDEENTEVRVAYLNAVKKLHPDLNPDLPEEARHLWDEIQAAYSMRDWAAVVALAELVDAVLAGTVEFPASSDGMAAMRKACDRLEAQCRGIADETERIKKKAPFTYEAVLGDKRKIKARQRKLKEAIIAMKAKIEKYKEEWGNV